MGIDVSISIPNGFHDPTILQTRCQVFIHIKILLDIRKRKAYIKNLRGGEEQNL